MRTFRDFRLSRGPSVLGLCSTDTPALLRYVNEAQERLLQINKNQGFWGTEVPMVFTSNLGYITAPRAVARISDLAVCGSAVNIQNGFFEFLSDGIGTKPVNACGIPCGALQALDRGMKPTLRDIDATNQQVRIYMTDARDAGKRVLVQGLDVNGLPIRSQDGNFQVLGQYLTLQSPFASIGFILTSVSGIQKDTTYGNVPLYQVDMTTGAEVLLSRYEPDEIEPHYRRYYVNNIPLKCCNTVNPVQLTGMVKLEMIPAAVDSDWLLIDNISALIAECQSIRFGDMESAEAASLSIRKHKEAVALLNNALDHYQGRNMPAIGILNAETASMNRARIGSLR